ncbi:MAG: hypothetical protein RBT76_08405 [candidate division Zixibacteria bacterium]|jgi:hypothetical protein|nr:hypothetical protein [candidate division Zixibacteria bacterium]
MSLECAIKKDGGYSERGIALPGWQEVLSGLAADNTGAARKP